MAVISRQEEVGFMKNTAKKVHAAQTLDLVSNNTASGMFLGFYVPR